MGVFLVAATLYLLVVVPDVRGYVCWTEGGVLKCKTPDGSVHIRPIKDVNKLDLGDRLLSAPPPSFLTTPILRLQEPTSSFFLENPRVINVMSTPESSTLVTRDVNLPVTDIGLRLAGASVSSLVPRSPNLSSSLVLVTTLHHTLSLRDEISSGIESARITTTLTADSVLSTSTSVHSFDTYSRPDVNLDASTAGMGTSTSAGATSTAGMGASPAARATSTAAQTDAFPVTLLLNRSNFYSDQSSFASEVISPAKLYTATTPHSIDFGNGLRSSDASTCCCREVTRRGDVRRLIRDGDVPERDAWFMRPSHVTRTFCSAGSCGDVDLRSTMRCFQKFRAVSISLHRLNQNNQTLVVPVEDGCECGAVPQPEASDVGQEVGQPHRGGQEDNTLVLKNGGLANIASMISASLVSLASVSNQLLSLIGISEPTNDAKALAGTLGETAGLIEQAADQLSDLNSTVVFASKLPHGALPLQSPAGVTKTVTVVTCFSEDATTTEITAKPTSKLGTSEGIVLATLSSTPFEILPEATSLISSPVLLTSKSSQIFTPTREVSQGQKPSSALVLPLPESSLSTKHTVTSTIYTSAQYSPITSLQPSLPTDVVGAGNLVTDKPTPASSSPTSALAVFEASTLFYDQTAFPQNQFLDHIIYHTQVTTLYVRNGTTFIQNIGGSPTAVQGGIAHPATDVQFTNPVDNSGLSSSTTRIQESKATAVLPTYTSDFTTGVSSSRITVKLPTATTISSSVSSQTELDTRTPTVAHFPEILTSAPVLDPSSTSVVTGVHITPTSISLPQTLTSATVTSSKTSSPVVTLSSAVLNFPTISTSDVEEGSGSGSGSSEERVIDIAKSLIVLKERMKECLVNQTEDTKAIFQSQNEEFLSQPLLQQARLMPIWRDFAASNILQDLDREKIKQCASTLNLTLPMTDISQDLASNLKSLPRVSGLLIATLELSHCLNLQTSCEALTGRRLRKRLAAAQLIGMKLTESRRSERNLVSLIDLVFVDSNNASFFDQDALQTNILSRISLIREFGRALDWSMAELSEAPNELAFDSLMVVLAYNAKLKPLLENYQESCLSQTKGQVTKFPSVTNPTPVSATEQVHSPSSPTRSTASPVTTTLPTTTIVRPTPTTSSPAASKTFTDVPEFHPIGLSLEEVRQLVFGPSKPKAT
ncbi:mucin-17-like [Hyalella azteca]|uniref:Mucin-17-like n=1 Tax=Hyalella azteca TaxID=294128 RepID=A0A8B7P8P3_HYAAZ|nr:mucin-17-like [Hyalella azteca]